MIRVPLHGGEKQLRQRPGAHGSNRTGNRTGEPGSRALTPRLALAVTSTPPGAGPAVRRSCTAATPPPSVRTVAGGTRVRAVSLVTSVTGPGVCGARMADTT